MSLVVTCAGTMICCVLCSCLMLFLKVPLHNRSGGFPPRFKPAGASMPSWLWISAKKLWTSCTSAMQVSSLTKLLCLVICSATDSSPVIGMVRHTSKSQCLIVTPCRLHTACGYSSAELHDDQPAWPCLQMGALACG